MKTVIAHCADAPDDRKVTIRIELALPDGMPDATRLHRWRVADAAMMRDAVAIAAALRHALPSETYRILCDELVRLVRVPG